MKDLCKCQSCGKYAIWYMILIVAKSVPIKMIFMTESPQFVVARGYNILKITETLLRDRNQQSILFLEVTTFLKTKSHYFQTEINTVIIVQGYNIRKVTKKFIFAQRPP